MKTVFISALAALLFLCLSGCIKERDLTSASPLTNSAIDTSFSKIKVAEGFNWSTTSQIRFRFTGSPQDEEQAVLKVALPDHSVLFQKLQNANEDFEAVLELPAHVTEVTVSYGDITKSFNCSSDINMTIE